MPHKKKKGFGAKPVKERDKPKTPTGQRPRGEVLPSGKTAGDIRKFQSTGQTKKIIGGKEVTPKQFEQFKRSGKLREEKDIGEFKEPIKPPVKPTEDVGELKISEKEFKEFGGLPNKPIIDTRLSPTAGIAGTTTFADQPESVKNLQSVLLGIASAGGIGLGTPGGITGGAVGTKISEAAAKQKSIANIAKISGKSENLIENLVNNRLAAQEINKVFGKTTAKFLGLGTGGTIGLFGVGALGADAYLFNWYALDNVIGGIKINSNKVVSDFQFSGGDPSEAIEVMEGSLGNANIAANKVRFSATYNPLMWPQSKLVLIGIEEDIAVIENNINKLRILQQGGVVTDELEPTETPEEVIETPEQTEVL